MKFIFKILNILIYPINFLLSILFKKKFSGKIIMVIGNHASGGTLIYQILSSNYKLNYMNNLSAKFYKNLFLAQILNIFLYKINKNYLSNLKSKNGITEGTFEPNEFGWFWRNILSKKKNLKINKFQGYIDELNCLFNIPFLFKYTVYPGINNLTKNIKFIKRLNNKILIIRIKRKPKNIENSIIRRRKYIFNDLNYNYGYFPKTIKAKDPITIVKKQVRLIEQEINKGLKKINNKDKILLNLDNLKKNPKKETHKLEIFLQNHSIIKKKNFGEILQNIKKY